MKVTYRQDSNDEKKYHLFDRFGVRTISSILSLTVSCRQISIMDMNMNMNTNMTSNTMVLYILLLAD